MIFPLLVLLSILPLLNSQDTTTNPETEPDYKVLDSPVFWIHAGFLIWGLISALIIASRFGKFCLLAYLGKRGKPLSCLSAFGLTVWMVHLVFNVPIFELPNFSKARRLSHCLLTFGLFSIFCALPVPSQAENQNALLQKPEFYIGIIPPIVDIILQITRKLLTFILERWYFKNKKDDYRIWIIVDIVIAIAVVGCITIQIILVIDLNHFKNDIWAKNIARSMSPFLLIIGIAFATGQTMTFHFLKSNYVKARPKLHKFFTEQLRPEMITLMELRTCDKKEPLTELTPQSSLIES